MSPSVKQGARNWQPYPGEPSRVNEIQGLASPKGVLLGNMPIRVNPFNYYLVAGAGVLTLGLLIGLPVALMSMGPPQKKASPAPVVANASENNHSPIPQVEREIPRPDVVAKAVAVNPARKSDTVHLIPDDQNNNQDSNVMSVIVPVEFASLQTKKIVDDGLPKIDEGVEWGPGNSEKRQFTVQDLNLSGLTIPDVYLKQLIQTVISQRNPQNNFTVSSPGAGQPGYVVNNPASNGPTYVINTPVIHLPQYVVVTPVINIPNFVITPPMMNSSNMLTMGPRGGNPTWMLPKWKPTQGSIMIPNSGGKHDNCTPSRLITFWGKMPGMIPNFGGGKMPGMVPQFGGGKMTAMIPNFGGGKMTGMIPNQGGGKQNIMTPPGFGGGGQISLTNFRGGGGNMAMPRFSGSGKASGGCMK